ncbi:Hint domain-containing protein [Rhodopseudomonas thermotolerans]|uniref:Hint domain-containing protein n=2 Tax=Rhodopseudomonas TaxID=1073 RepID=A0A336JME7_9BRAD|nr:MULTISPECIES: Hint domain-containing protein [Rhodopseudomonas]RED35197.1 Hint domain-containing protein [Rhodopseudomonas pentothenatexigens]REG03040.1 Hint domain-containing protein [Rhodopseudomonas thermotolerans]SSW90887.1 Hint domain-containing protein [Rhodopseudomonas pentothenatexigens]
MNQNRDETDTPAGTTRRTLITSHAKAMVGIAAGVVAASLARVTSAHAVVRPPCYLKGTRIRTVDGDRAIEELSVGDLLPTALAGVQPIEWIGSWRHSKAAGRSWPDSARPVRIAKSALGPNVPGADLYVTQGHALYIDGVLVTAGSLINGTSIVLDAGERFAELEYYHIKLPGHAVIFAEGAACETLRQLPAPASGYDTNVRSGAVSRQDETCAPVLYSGTSGEIRARLRSMLSPMLGPQKLDLIRARLAEAAVAL